MGVDISLSLIVAFVLVSIAIFIYLLKIIIEQKDQKVKTGIDQMKSATAKVVKKQGNTYKVSIHSEIWNAISKEEINEGDEVIVESMEGLTLHIKSKE